MSKANNTQYSTRQIKAIEKYYSDYSDWWQRCLADEPGMKRFPRARVREFACKSLKLRVNKAARLEHAGEVTMRYPDLPVLYTPEEVISIGVLDQSDIVTRFFTSWETAVLRLYFRNSENWYEKVLQAAPALGRKTDWHICRYARDTLKLKNKVPETVKIVRKPGRIRDDGPAAKDSLEVADSVLKGYGFV